MNWSAGLWRIWIVGTALLFAFVTIVVVHDGTHDSFTESKPSFCVPGTSESQADYEVLREPAKTFEDVVRQYELPEKRREFTSYRCLSWWTLIIGWTIVLGAALAVLGAAFTLRWIAAGFQRSNPNA